MKQYIDDERIFKSIIQVSKRKIVQTSDKLKFFAPRFPSSTFTVPYDKKPALVS